MKRNDFRGFAIPVVVAIITVIFMIVISLSLFSNMNVRIESRISNFEQLSSYADLMRMEALTRLKDSSSISPLTGRTRQYSYKVILKKEPDSILVYSACTKNGVCVILAAECSGMNSKCRKLYYFDQDNIDIKLSIVEQEFEKYRKSLIEI